MVDQDQKSIKSEIKNVIVSLISKVNIQKLEKNNATVSKNPVVLQAKLKSKTC
ncbi:hypothetical protein [Mesomycoplasma hyopneumoniae]|uniref:hypothetical protein n=1 Tax=Mesomycoplasma hyopneumoniae TaxID=2099 RepID=UPI001438577E|nr:hypothetical protein [Mesomycoplasma hyopneumoniae]NYN92036.1 hypothetical protein [Mesomycoplasma hyopneumoniae]QLG43326.1 hypothetical protein HZK19_01050 [Mesomycoplasma hyopneumoniae]